MKLRIKRMIQYSILFLVIFNIFSINNVLSQESSILDQADQNETTALDLPVYRAVIVGLGASQGLPYSVKQVKGFKTTLINGGNWKEENIKILTESNAKKHIINYEIEWLAENADDNDISMFYFVGHGSGNGTNECIVIDDGTIYDTELDEYLDMINGSIVVIIDACKSGGFIEEVEAPNRTILTACGKNEVTYQVADLESSMFGFFINLSLTWVTKNIEATFQSTRVFTWFYGNKISREFGEDYRIYPKMSDGNPKITPIIYKHTYGKQIINLIQKMLDNDGINNYWLM